MGQTKASQTLDLFYSFFDASSDLLLMFAPKRLSLPCKSERGSCPCSPDDHVLRSIHSRGYKGGFRTSAWLYVQSFVSVGMQNTYHFA